MAIFNIFSICVFPVTNNERIFKRYQVVYRRVAVPHQLPYTTSGSEQVKTSAWALLSKTNELLMCQLLGKIVIFHPLALIGLSLANEMLVNDDFPQESLCGELCYMSHSSVQSPLGCNTKPYKGAQVVFLHELYKLPQLLLFFTSYAMYIICCLNNQFKCLFSVSLSFEIAMCH